MDKLTEFENHRTNTQFEDAYCSKLFSFVFVNSYLSVLYIAFVAEHMPKVKSMSEIPFGVLPARVTPGPAVICRGNCHVSP